MLLKHSYTRQTLLTLSLQGAFLVVQSKQLFSSLSFFLKSKRAPVSTTLPRNGGVTQLYFHRRDFALHLTDFHTVLRADSLGLKAHQLIMPLLGSLQNTLTSTHHRFTLRKSQNSVFLTQNCNSILQKLYNGLYERAQKLYSRVHSSKSKMWDHKNYQQSRADMFFHSFKSIACLA